MVPITAKKAEKVCSACHARLNASVSIETACKTKDNENIVKKELVGSFIIHTSIHSH